MHSQAFVPMERYRRKLYRPDRDYIDGHLEARNWGESPHARLQLRLAVALLKQVPAGFEVLPSIRIRVAESRIRVADICVAHASEEPIVTTPPVLCVEVVSPRDRMTRILQRTRDYLQMGVPYVWLVETETRSSFVATPGEGLREVKSGVLRTENPSLQVPLSEFFD